MTVPAFLNSSHRYLSVPGVTDVDDIITNVRSELVTNGDPAWTEPSTALFKSPVDAQSRWFDVLLTKISATKLEIRVRDDTGTTIFTGRIWIDAGGTEIKIYSGEYHLSIDACRATYENFRCGILDLSPQAQDAWGNAVYASAYRDSGDSTWGDRFYTASWNGISNYACVLMPLTNDDSPIGSDPAGNVISWPAFVRYSGALAQLRGRFYQGLLVPYTLANGVELTVPIDTGVTAAFRVSGAFATAFYKLAYRSD